MVIQQSCLEDLCKDLLKMESLEQKLEVVENFLENPQKSFDFLDEEEKLVLFSLIAIGQGEEILRGAQKEEVKTLLDTLVPMQRFYQEIGGIVGYHVMCLRLLEEKGKREKKGNYHVPNSIEIAEETSENQECTLEGVRHLDTLGEIYPLGGAADRLSILNEEASSFQIAATFEFCQRSLLQRLIDDLQAREYLHYKLFGKEVRIPIVIMTSDEKQGDAQVREMFREKNWFGRREEDFFLFSQPLVPAMNSDGQWCVLGPGRILMKPGGHGVIWKLASELGALKWLKQKGVKKILTRQINNLVASVDYGLLAFLGIGFSQNLDFGFASCPCARGMSEGVNIVIENEEGYSLTNIEYCDTEHFQVEDSLLANTNLLLVDLKSIPELLSSNPIPGMLVNAKKMKYRDAKGSVREEEILRLESMMQNLADALVEKKFPKRSFITSNHRKKTISTIKKEFAFGSSMVQTPEQCYLDILENARDLLVNYCGFHVPKLRDATHFFQQGPSFIFHYHPSLGPLYQVIGQKLRKGRFAMGTEVKLAIADLDAENLDVDGSLSIYTDAMMGHTDEEGILHYSDQTGKCFLKNVKVRNSGINREASRCLWKDEIAHREQCEIFIEEGGEFHAENVLLRGDMRIRVPSGVKVTATMHHGRLKLSQEVVAESSWTWKYTVGSENAVCLDHA